MGRKDLSEQKTFMVRPEMTRNVQIEGEGNSRNVQHTQRPWSGNWKKISVTQGL